MVKVILLKKIDNLGDVSDQVLVKPGYARNFLLPYGKATFATAEKIATLERHRKALQTLETEQLKEAKMYARRLEGKVFYITAKASNKGKLFGSIGLREISKAICSDSGINIKKYLIKLPTRSIRQIGEYEVIIQFHAKVSIKSKIVVSSST
ncbi:50S ribosomal protein L9 [Coxiella endosymbiont of Amblyomma americanum]|uniref:50S ribosomal protein L9 n=1 Tax=Coxiella endosymbiont of Amblyomma americanum TaxID=325775 RepID=UPI00057D45D8|nr:50S ribosomal protein L9 [Coxiella endosymbiont of Amblyomma americanum]AJC50559.1 LSU ribosomal protein L9P [Coxiella endosymbiont of Amblyomma americanum]AUJ58892.1 50S ribosomal protein L9 [Coxiella-like endosymbiont of Amblyomma americanum]